jgi:hypothetical protein
MKWENDHCKHGIKPEEESGQDLDHKMRDCRSLMEGGSAPRATYTFEDRIEGLVAYITQRSSFIQNFIASYDSRVPEISKKSLSECIEECREERIRITKDPKVGAIFYDSDPRW